MNAATPTVSGRSTASAAVLWACIALFYARVIGQVEVLLVSPDWLPPMPAWYSGLLPYPVLLPCQIILLALLCVMARNASRRPHSPAAVRCARFCKYFALLYAISMAVRLGIVVVRYGSQFFMHGAIPVAFHWVLALFLLVWTRLYMPEPQR